MQNRGNAVTKCFGRGEGLLPCFCTSRGPAPDAGIAALRIARLIALLRLQSQKFRDRRAQILALQAPGKEVEAAPLH